MLLFDPIVAPNFSLFGAINPKLNPGLPFVILNLEVQRQRDPYTDTQVRKLEKCLLRN